MLFHEDNKFSLTIFATASLINLEKERTVFYSTFWIHGHQKIKQPIVILADENRFFTKAWSVNDGGAGKWSGPTSNEGRFSSNKDDSG